MYVCYVDYEKVFDHVDWTKLMEDILKNLGVGWRDMKLIWNLYNDQAAYVRIRSVVERQQYVHKSHVKSFKVSEAAILNLVFGA